MATRNNLPFPPVLVRAMGADVDSGVDAAAAAGARPTAKGTVDEAVEVLNDLLENARDLEYGFRTCAKEVPSTSSLRQVFNRRASQYHEACDELAQLVRRHGGSPVEGGTTSGAIHRGWVNLKGSIGSNSEMSMLEECERGEAAAAARYRKAMKRHLPPDVRSLVERQAASAQHSHDRFKGLHDQARTHS